MHRIVPIILSAALVVSCSTTKLLPEGSSRLADNSIEFTGGQKLQASELSSYIKQESNKSLFGWNPFLYVYNWSDGSSKGINRVWERLGEKPVVFDESLVEASEKNMANHLEYLGYYDSDVASEVTIKGRTAHVKYIVNPGRRFVIDSVSFILPADPEFQAAWAEDSARVTIHKGDYLSEDALRTEAARSSEFLRQRGCYGLTESGYAFMADTLSVPGTLILEYQILEPVQRYTVGNVEISTPASLKFKEGVLRGMNLINPGDVYSERRVKNTYSRLSSLKVFNGVNIQMNPSEANPGTVDCGVVLSQAKVQGVKANLEASTNSSGLIGLSPQLNFYHKNFFHGGEWLNLGFSGNYQFKLDDDTRATEYGVSLGLSIPRFLGLPYRFFNGPSVPRTEVNLAFNYQNRPEYTRNVLSASFGYTGMYLRHFSYQVYPLQVSFVRLDNLDPDFSDVLDRNPFMKYSYQDHFDAGVGGTLYYSTNMEVVPKTSYWYTRLNFDLSGNIISIFGRPRIWGAPYAQYVKAELSYGRTFRFGMEDQNSLAFRVLGGAGYAYGNSTSLPYEKQFYCGGSGSMRGWQSRALGPGSSPLNTYFSIPSQTGDLKLEADVEFRFRMFAMLEGALFAETGNIWTLNDSDEASRFNPSTFYQTLAADWGIGLRVGLDFILLRLDMGMKLRDPSRSTPWVGPAGWFKSDGFAIHFGVGYPF